MSLMFLAMDDVSNLELRGSEGRLISSPSLSVLTVNHCRDR